MGFHIRDSRSTETNQRQDDSLRREERFAWRLCVLLRPQPPMEKTDDDSLTQSPESPPLANKMFQKSRFNTTMPFADCTYNVQGHNMKLNGGFSCLIGQTLSGRCSWSRCAPAPFFIFLYRVLLSWAAYCAADSLMGGGFLRSEF